VSSEDDKDDNDGDDDHVGDDEDGDAIFNARTAATTGKGRGKSGPQKGKAGKRPIGMEGKKLKNGERMWAATTYQELVNQKKDRASRRSTSSESTEEIDVDAVKSVIKAFNPTDKYRKCLMTIAVVTTIAKRAVANLPVVNGRNGGRKRKTRDENEEESEQQSKESKGLSKAAIRREKIKDGEKKLAAAAAHSESLQTRAKNDIAALRAFSNSFTSVTESTEVEAEEWLKDGLKLQNELAEDASAIGNKNANETWSLASEMQVALRTLGSKCVSRTFGREFRIAQGMVATYGADRPMPIHDPTKTIRKPKAKQSDGASALAGTSSKIHSITKVQLRTHHRNSARLVAMSNDCLTRKTSVTHPSQSSSSSGMNVVEMTEEEFCAAKLTFLSLLQRRSEHHVATKGLAVKASAMSFFVHAADDGVSSGEFDIDNVNDPDFPLMLELFCAIKGVKESAKQLVKSTTKHIKYVGNV